VAKPQTFNGAAGKVLGFLTVCKRDQEIFGRKRF